jgi:hypothetical protein
LIATINAADAHRKAFARRWWYAALCAAWMTSWPLLVLESSRGMPGIISFRGDRGLYDLLEMVFQGPVWQLHLAVFLAFALIFRALLGAAAWLDRDGRAANTLRWVWAGRSLRRLALSAMILAVAMLALPSEARHIAGMASVLFALLASVVGYFFVWNPQTLQRESLAAWWRPHWPGWKTTAAVFALMLTASAGLDVAALWWGQDRRAWLQFLGWAASFLAEIALTLTAYAIWFGYRRRNALRTVWSRMCRLDLLRAYIALDVYSAIVFFLVAAPVLVSTIVAIYFEPQFQDWATAHGERLPWLFQSIAAAGRGFREDLVWLVFVLALGMLWAFAEARLIFHDGLGAELGPDARRR